MNNMNEHLEISCSKVEPQKDKVFITTKIKKHKNWTKQEDKLLIEIANKFKQKSWTKVAMYFQDKNPAQCRARYKRIRPGIVKGAWTKEEDQMILELVKKSGKNWALISKLMPTRNGKQIRDRFLNYLDPNINKIKFTDEDDKKIIEHYIKYGSKWSIIAKFFDGRTGDMIKNRFYSCLKRKVHVYEVCSNKRIRKKYYKPKKLNLQAGVIENPCNSSQDKINNSNFIVNNCQTNNFNSEFDTRKNDNLNIDNDSKEGSSNDLTGINLIINQNNRFSLKNDKKLNNLNNVFPIKQNSFNESNSANPHASAHKPHAQHANINYNNYLLENYIKFVTNGQQNFDNFENYQNYQNCQNYYNNQIYDPTANEAITQNLENLNMYTMAKILNLKNQLAGVGVGVDVGLDLGLGFNQINSLNYTGGVTGEGTGGVINPQNIQTNLNNSNNPNNFHKFYGQNNYPNNYSNNNQLNNAQNEFLLLLGLTPQSNNFTNLNK